MAAAPIFYSSQGHLGSKIQDYLMSQERKRSRTKIGRDSIEIRYKPSFLADIIFDGYRLFSSRGNRKYVFRVVSTWNDVTRR
ncbi:hypothetical protein TNCV_1245281 [Trichonephila clavipes]|nr:hypothetical protein TNCV_1245281 [Trichonephila clavipes]